VSTNTKKKSTCCVNYVLSLSSFQQAIGSMCMKGGIVGCTAYQVPSASTITIVAEAASVCAVVAARVSMPVQPLPHASGGCGVNCNSEMYI